MGMGMVVFCLSASCSMIRLAVSYDFVIRECCCCCQFVCQCVLFGIVSFFSFTLVALETTFDDSCDGFEFLSVFLTYVDKQEVENHLFFFFLHFYVPSSSKCLDHQHNERSHHILFVCVCVRGLVEARCDYGCREADQQHYVIVSAHKSVQMSFEDDDELVQVIHLLVGNTNIEESYDSVLPQHRISQSPSL